MYLEQKLFNTFFVITLFQSNNSIHNFKHRIYFEIYKLIRNNSDHFLCFVCDIRELIHTFSLQYKLIYSNDWRYFKKRPSMRKLSLDQVYGCSTAHRNSIIGLPDNRVAFLAGSYLVILDCLTNEQRYLSFSAIEFLYISSSSLLMGIIDRLTQYGDTRIHIYSTKPIDLLFVIEPDRFGNFIGISINNHDNILMILHSEPGYMITIRK
jgi:hypothetical protein